MIRKASSTKTNRSLNEDQSGLTLIEVIVATAVTGILIGIIMNFMTGQMVQNAMQNARAILLLESQTALDIVNSDIKHASRVDDINRWEDPNAPGSPDDPYSWVPGDDVLILATPAKDSNGDFIYDDPFAYITHKDNIVYFVEDGTLYKRTIAGNATENDASTSCPSGGSGCPSDMELINNVVDFHINYYDAYDQDVPPDEARSVNVSITVTDTVYGRDITESYAVRSVFRNE